MSARVASLVVFVALAVLAAPLGMPLGAHAWSPPKTPTLRGAGQPAADAAPQQITIAYAGANTDAMAISWETVVAANTVVHFGPSPTNLTTIVTGSSTQYTLYTYTSDHIHHAVLPSLGNEQQVFYSCGDPGLAGGMSAVYNFTTAPAPGNTDPFTLAIVGDLGQTKYSAETLAHVMATPNLQAVMLAGDLSYADLDEQRWDSWGTMVQPSTASLPWMFAPGNHEIENATGLCPVVACGPLTGDCYEDSTCHGIEEYCEYAAGCSDWACKASCLSRNAGSNALAAKLGQCLTGAIAQCSKDAARDPHPPTFLSYDTRFRMPWAESGSTSNQWYSWEAGPMHFTILNSYAPYTAGTPQYEWLVKDLAGVDRARTPWLFVVFHCPWYNSDVAHHGEGDAMRAALEQTLYDAKVAMVFSGHVHAYERSFPVFQGTRAAGAPTYIVIGDGGNREGLATSYYPQPAWSAFRQANYGHGQLYVANATHVHFMWHRDIDGEPVVTDQVWVTNNWSA